MQVYIKLVCWLDTTRNLGWIEAKAQNSLRSGYQSEYAKALANDPNITIEDWRYRWKAAELGGQVEIYPKLVANIDTTYTVQEIRAKLDAAIPTLKQAFRNELGADPQTTITGWHVHYSAACVDEVEA